MVSGLISVSVVAFPAKNVEGKNALSSFSKRSINVATFELHESHCLRHIKLCDVCNEPVPVVEMTTHFEENHAPTPCDLCGLQVPADQHEDHKVCSYALWFIYTYVPIERQG